MRVRAAPRNVPVRVRPPVRLEARSRGPLKTAPKKSDRGSGVVSQRERDDARTAHTRGTLENDAALTSDPIREVEAPKPRPKRSADPSPR
jgi:hypothetical protein